MAIELSFTGICEGCREFDLELVELIQHGQLRRCAVRCRHVAACSALAKREKERKEKQDYKSYSYQPQESSPRKETVDLPSGNVAQKE